MNRKHVVSL